MFFLLFKFIGHMNVDWTWTSHSDQPLKIRKALLIIYAFYLRKQCNVNVSIRKPHELNCRCVKSHLKILVQAWHTWFMLRCTNIYANIIKIWVNCYMCNWTKLNWLQQRILCFQTILSNYYNLLTNSMKV